ncbi:hypothetical protein V6Z11_A13G229300 [Gossypium hirsutum]
MTKKSKKRNTATNPFIKYTIKTLSRFQKTKFLPFPLKVTVSQSQENEKMSSSISAFDFFKDGRTLDDSLKSAPLFWLLFL